MIYNLDSDFEVQEIMRSGADLMAITNTVMDVKLLTKNNLVVVWRGTRDISRNKTSGGLNQLKDFYRNNYQMNIIQMCVSHRYDLPGDSCVNKEAVVFNRKLDKLMKAFEHKLSISISKSISISIS
jgi:hypothetical protein